MDDKSAVVVAQYDIEVTGYSRQKGAGILQTNQGLLLLRQRDAKERRVCFEEEIKEAGGASGDLLLDRCVPNREGNFVTEGDYGETFLLRHWQEGEELELSDRNHRLLAAETLGRFHKRMRGLPIREEYVREDFGTVCARHIRELRRLSTYLYKRKQKNPFEQKLQEILPEYIERAEQALRIFLSAPWKPVYEEVRNEGHGVHGAFGNHALIVKTDGEIFISNFEKAGIGPQMEDFCYLVRKSMEKTGYDTGTFQEMLDAYQKERKLRRREALILESMLLFPEKFYRVCNQYFNARKDWIPARNSQKLLDVLMQQEQKCEFDEKVGGMLLENCAD